MSSELKLLEKVQNKTTQKGFGFDTRNRGPGNGG